MLSISEAVRRAIERDGFLHFGIANGVLNLTKTARFILPLIKARTKKNVSLSAATMALSRLKLAKRKMNAALKDVRVTSLNVTKHLVEVTYDKTGENIRAVEAVEQAMRRKGAFAAVTLGTSEITLLFEARNLGAVKRRMPGRAKAEIADLVAVGVQFDETYIPHAGMIYALVQQLAFQNINIIEMSSTYTELIFYLGKKDLKLAFDTLYDQFM